MAKKQMLTTNDLSKLAKLASLPVTDAQASSLQTGIQATLEYARVLETVDVSHLAETREVSNLHNVWREDVVDKDRMLSQADALKNASSTHDGYFMVKAVFEKE